MSSEVTAAIIAASVSVLTLIGTLAAQYFGRRATSRDTQKTFAEQHEQLDKTLAAQGKQLDRTLEEQRTRTLNERFATAAGQLGDDKPPAVRLAGVYAMAGLADDWFENQQTCVDVLCGYLRMPYEPDPGQDAPEPERLAFRASREVRHTVIRVITAHLQKDRYAATSWRGLNFDFTGAVFDGGDFAGAVFSGGEVSFDRAVFSGGEVDFGGAEFSDRGAVSFVHAGFSGSAVSFDYARFSGGQVRFVHAEFSGGQVRLGAVFSSGEVDFGGAVFSGGAVSFVHAGFSGSAVRFFGAEFSDRGAVSFDRAVFSGGTVSFVHAGFSGGTVDFGRAWFYGGTVEFSDPRDWSFPPEFPWTDTPPPGVKLPKKEDQSQA